MTPHAQLVAAAKAMLDALAYSMEKAASDDLEVWADVNSRGKKAESELRAALANCEATGAGDAGE